VSAAAPGPLAEEASRLVEAISEWARGAVGDVHLPSAGGAAECQVCPFCQLLGLLRRTQPETFGHLAEASASLVAALRTVVERAEPAPRHSGVERVDLDDGDSADPVAADPGRAT